MKRPETTASNRRFRSPASTPDRKPSVPRFTPKSGIPRGATSRATRSIVPSPPSAIAKSARRIDSLDGRPAATQVATPRFLSRARRCLRARTASGFDSLWKIRAAPNARREECLDVEEVAIGGRLERAGPRSSDYSKRALGPPGRGFLDISCEERDFSEAEPKRAAHEHALDRSGSQRQGGAADGGVRRLGSGVQRAAAGEAHERGARLARQEDHGHRRRRKPQRSRRPQDERECGESSGEAPSRPRDERCEEQEIRGDLVGTPRAQLDGGPGHGGRADADALERRERAVGGPRDER